MKLLLNAGNVKGKIISGLKNVFRKNCRHFILLLAGKNDFVSGGDNMYKRAKNV